jgi:hypothetical protein
MGHYASEMCCPEDRSKKDPGEIDQLELDYALGQRRFVRHLDDCMRIVKVVRAAGAELMHYQAERIWQWHSDSRSVPWVSVAACSDRDILGAVRAFIKHHNRLDS